VIGPTAGANSCVALSGVHKNVVVVEAGTKVEADLAATNPGDTLFQCRQRDQMDCGFMGLFRCAQEECG
jgi:FtsP/CotA-like multicopper oxidase with cupredoxin domain